MAIDKIGALSNIQSAYTNQIRRESGTDATDKRSDKVEISNSRVGQLREAVTKAVANADEVRPEKVAAAKEKLDRGSLVNDQVIAEIASRIVDSLGI